MAAKSATQKDIEELRKIFEAFREQYEADMRGDKDMTNGNIGIVNTIRLLKKSIEDYPSVTYLLSKKPISTISIGIGVWLLIATLYQFGLLKIIAKVFGVELP